MGEKLYVYGVVFTAAAKKNSIIKIDRRWLCRGFGQGPKLESVSHRNICTNIQFMQKEKSHIFSTGGKFLKNLCSYISKGNTGFGNDLALFFLFLLYK